MCACSGVGCNDILLTHADGCPPSHVSQKLAATSWGNYIYTSTNSGATWTIQIDAGFGSWGSIASSSDGTVRSQRTPRAIATPAALPQSAAHIPHFSLAATAWLAACVRVAVWVAMTPYLPMPMPIRPHTSQKLAAAVTGTSIWTSS